MKPFTPRTGLRLALGHQSRVGKDTFADIVVSRHNGCTFAFAKDVYGLSQIVQSFFGKPIEKDPALLQALGTVMRTCYGDDVWAGPVMRRITELIEAKPNINIIVTDMRAVNEMESLKAAGFTTIKIVRKNRPIDRDPTHISETALADASFDYTINNDGSVEEFQLAVTAFIDRLP